MLMGFKSCSKHVDNNGDMNEQFNKYIGFMQGAEKLTWSYGAVFTAINWRNKLYQFIIIMKFWTKEGLNR